MPYITSHKNDFQNYCKYLEMWVLKAIVFTHCSTLFLYPNNDNVHSHVPLHG